MINKEFKISNKEFKNQLLHILSEDNEFLDEIKYLILIGKDYKEISYLKKENEDLNKNLNELIKVNNELTKDVEFYKQKKNTLSEDLNAKIVDFKFKDYKYKKKIEELEKIKDKFSITIVNLKNENSKLISDYQEIKKNTPIEDNLILKPQDNTQKSINNISQNTKNKVQKENSIYKIDFKNKVNLTAPYKKLESKKKNNTSTIRNLFPRHEIMSKEELKKYSESLKHKFYYNIGIDSEYEGKIFKFLVSFAFYYYENSDFWHPLCDFIGINFNNYVINTFYKKIKSAADMYNFLYYVDSANRNAYVETIKMHTIIPLNYIYNILPILYTIYRRDLKGTPDKVVFSKIIEDKFNNKELHTIKTLEHLWEMKLQSTVIDHLYELLVAIDTFDRNITLENTNLREDILKEVKEWCSHVNSTLYVTKGSIAHYFDRDDLKDPNFVLDYNNKKLAIKSFSLPDDILKVKLKITYTEKNQKKEIIKPLIYTHKNGLYHTKETAIADITESMVFGKYEIILDTDNEKDVSIYTEKKSYILLNESYVQIKNLEGYSKDNFYVQYLSDYYDVVSSNDITIEDVDDGIQRTLLNKTHINYLRDTLKERVSKRLSVVKTSGINFISSKVEGLSVDNSPVFNSHPYIDGFISKEHTLYVNGKKEFNIPTDDIGEYTITIKSRSGNKIINSVKYYLIPNLSISFSSYYGSMKKRYIFEKPDEMNIFIKTESFDHVSTEKYIDSENITREKDGFDLLIDAELIDHYYKTGEVFLDLSYGQKVISTKYRLPVLRWQLGSDKINQYGGEIWKNEIITNTLKVYLGGQQAVMSLPLNEFIDLKDSKDINFNMIVNRALKIHNIKESLFNIVTTPVIYNKGSNIFTIYPISDDNILEISNKGKKLLNRPFNNSSNPIEFDASEYNGSLVFNIKSYDPFAFDDNESLFKTEIFINDELKIGDILTVSQMEIYDKHDNIESTIPLGTGIKFEYLGEEKEGYCIGKILGFKPSQKNKKLFDDKLHFKLNESKLVIRKLKLKQINNKFLPLKYKLGLNSSLKTLYVGEENLKHWEKDNQRFGFKLKKES